MTPGDTLDRLLNGPTNDVWIDPWVAYLSGRGATYHLHHEVKAIHVGPSAGPGSAIEILGVDIDGPGGLTTHTADYYVLAMPVERVTPLLTLDLVTAAPELAGLSQLQTSWMNGIMFYLRSDVRLARGHVIYSDSPWARAVNGILRVSGSSAAPCEVWSFQEPALFGPLRRHDAKRWEAGKANLFALDIVR